MKKIIFFLIPFLMSGCAYNLVEEIQFHQNRTADIKLGLDFSKSLDSENKDMIIDMVSKGAKGLAEKLGKGEAQTSGKSMSSSINNIFTEARDSLKPVLFEVAFDTIAQLKKDSLRISLFKKDSLNKILPEQRAVVSNMVYYLIKNARMKVHMDVPGKIMQFEVELRSISWDSLNYYNIAAFKKGGELANLDKTYASIGEIFPEWNGNEITRSNNDYNVANTTGDQKLDEQTKSALEKSLLIIKYHFPGPIKSCSNKLYKIDDNRLTAIFTQSFYGLYKSKPQVSAIIKY